MLPTFFGIKRSGSVGNANECGTMKKLQKKLYFTKHQSNAESEIQFFVFLSDRRSEVYAGDGRRPRFAPLIDGGCALLRASDEADIRGAGIERKCGAVRFC